MRKKYIILKIYNLYYSCIISLEQHSVKKRENNFIIFILKEKKIRDPQIPQKHLMLHKFCYFYT